MLKIIKVLIEEFSCKSNLTVIYFNVNSRKSYHVECAATFIDFGCLFHDKILKIQVRLLVKLLLSFGVSFCMVLTMFHHINKEMSRKLIQGI